MNPAVLQALIAFVGGNQELAQTYSVTSLFKLFAALGGVTDIDTLMKKVMETPPASQSVQPAQGNVPPTQETPDPMQQ